jgi:hypothetical protein
MNKYRNVSGTTLHIDCIACTIHMEPQQILFLPRCRDARFYTKIGKLVVVRKEITKPRFQDNTPVPKKRGKKRTQKWKNKKEETIKHEKVENK